MMFCLKVETIHAKYIKVYHHNMTVKEQNK